MEFDEMKKIWDSQNNQPLYVIDEAALQNRILSKKRQVRHISNISEWLLIIVNAGGAFAVFGVNVSNHSNSWWMYLLSVWMFVVACYTFLSRMYRMKGEHRFDRTMRGDLSHAIFVATYQVRLSKLMQWNILPIAILVALGMWGTGKPLWITGSLILFFMLTAYASRWEHRIYERKKRELESLRDKLEIEN